MCAHLLGKSSSPTAGPSCIESWVVLLKMDRGGPETEFKAEKSPGDYLFCVLQMSGLLLCPS